jgi:hypothetical protein
MYPLLIMPDPTPYERLGGVYGIATVVDDLVARVMADEPQSSAGRVQVPGDGNGLLGG